MKLVPCSLKVSTTAGEQAVHWLRLALAHGSPAFMAHIVPELAASPHPQVRALVAPPSL